MKPFYRLIAFDMDGTLLDSRSRIAPETAEAVSEAVKAGKTVILSTGRGPAELKDFLDLIPEVRYANCLSGGLLFDMKERRVLAEKDMEKETVRRLFRLAEEEDAMAYILTEKAYLQRSCFEHLDDYNMGFCRAFYSRVAEQQEDLEGTWLREQYPVPKFNIYHRSPKSRERTRQRISELGVPVEAVNSDIANLEISPKGVSKGSGLRTLCEKLRIPLSEVIAVGDADNDLDVLETVQKAGGLAVAMGNANEMVQSIAGAVVADNDHGGCAETIQRFLL